LALRSHVDIDTEIGLKGLESVLSLKESHGHLVDIQTVAFPQSGVIRDAGTADLLDAAIAAGADLVGGLDPAGIDNDIDGHLDAIFGIASKHGVGLDIHLHDGEALGALELREIAARGRALGLEGRLAVSHAFCLGELDDADFGRTAEALAEAGVAIMTTGPGPVPMPPVKRLKRYGVRVFCGSDNIRDAWSPFGNGDMLERAGVVCDRQNFRSDADLEEAFALATDAPAAVLGRPTPLQVGAKADFLILPAGSIAEAVAARPVDRAVFRNGVVVARGGRLLAPGG
jgi:cytosine deaminase